MSMSLSERSRSAEAASSSESACLAQRSRCVRELESGTL
jgi:hypothetical protein